MYCESKLQRKSDCSLRTREGSARGAKICVSVNPLLCSIERAASEASTSTCTGASGVVASSKTFDRVADRFFKILERPKVDKTLRRTYVCVSKTSLQASEYELNDPRGRGVLLYAGTANCNHLLQPRQKLQSNFGKLKCDRPRSNLIEANPLALACRRTRKATAAHYNLHNQERPFEKSTRKVTTGGP